MSRLLGNKPDCAREAAAGGRDWASREVPDILNRTALALLDFAFFGEGIGARIAGVRRPSILDVLLLGLAAEIRHDRLPSPVTLQP